MINLYCLIWGECVQVFRICDKAEVDKIFKDMDFKDIGASGKMHKRKPGEATVNNHVYDEDEMYMHFFPKFSDLFYINLEKGKCVCTYDIPEEILDASLGYGEYMDLFTYSIPRKVPEYCINNKLLKFEYLTQVKLLTNDISYIDFLSEEPLDDFYELIYSKQASKHK